MNPRQLPDPVEESGLPHVYLLPGTLYCAAQPTLVTTVLGSCVAVCLSDRRRAFSGINHFVLPRLERAHPSLRYGDFSIDQLVQAMRGLGSAVHDLEAKVFGGAAVLAMASSERNIGIQNADIAIERLQSLRIPVVARRTGGKCGMAIRLFTASGDVLVRRIKSSATQRSDGQASPASPATGSRRAR
jgi:chemotaxis protein CheD